MAPITLRLRAPSGQARIQFDLATAGKNALEAMAAASLALPKDSAFFIALDPQGTRRVEQSDLPKLKHGDLLYVIGASSEAPAVDIQKRQSVAQTAIDLLLVKMKGTITRERDPNFCRHGSSGMCDYCMPLEPYDPTYLDQNKIKHMSFHAYLKQKLISSKMDNVNVSADTFIPPLGQESYRVKVPCPARTHEAWPTGICTKCQPSAITLSSQNFRMVDHVEFETSQLIETFIKFWRSTGAQRFGLLYGRYEPYTDKVPLGVKAVVSVIYEPPQENTPSYLQLVTPNPDEQNVNGVAGALGLELIGMIYTDLVDDGTGKGTVICKRHKDSYFLSSAEALFSAHLQSVYPITTPYSSTSTFGSRFVTCVVTGNEDSGIDLQCFQISNVGMQMVSDGIVEASVEPGLVRVKESSRDVYVPEVFYTFKNAYGLMVKEAAKPTFPVEYFLVTLSHGFPQDPKPTFKTLDPFPTENRFGLTLEAIPSLHALHTRLSTVSELQTALSDFHLLLYLSTLGLLEPPEFVKLCAAVRSGEGLDRVVGSSGFATLMMVLEEGAQAERGSGGGGSSSSGGAGGNGSSGINSSWTCRHCTFVNHGGGDCEVCGLPRDG